MCARVYSQAGLEVEVVSGLVVRSNDQSEVMTTSPLPSTPRMPNGESIKADDARFAHRKWLAVAIDDSWFLVDAHPAPEHYLEPVGRLPVDQDSVDSRQTHHTVGGISSTKSPTAGADRGGDTVAYFMTDPEEFVYSHFPADAKWQLLARPVRIDEFMTMADLTAAFFRLRLEPNTHLVRNIEFREDSEAYDEDDDDAEEHRDNEDRHQLVIVLEQPISALYRYDYRLTKLGSSSTANRASAGGENTTASTSLDQYVMVENRTDGKLLCSIRFPSYDRYLFELYGCDADDPIRSVYRLVCSYHIDAVAPSSSSSPRSKPAPLPANRRREWGPSWALERVGLGAASHDEATICVDEHDAGELDVVFDVLQNNEPADADDVEASTPTIVDDCGRFLVNVSSNRKSKNEMRRYVMLYDDEDRRRLVVRVKFPEPGWYALSLLAKSAADSRQQTNNAGGGEDGAGGAGSAPPVMTAVRFSVVCCYLVKVAVAAPDPTPYPKVTSGRLGRTELATRLGVRPVSHRSAYFGVSDGGELEMTFASATRCSFMAELRLHRQRGAAVVDDGKELDDMVFIEENASSDENGVDATFRVRFHEKGVYTLKLFGRDRARATSRYAPIYTYIIDVERATAKFVPFPRRYVHWSEGCRLVRPVGLVGVLHAHDVVPFAVRVPGAVDVRLTKSDGGVVELNQTTSTTGDDDDNRGGGDDENDVELWCADFNVGPVGEVTLSAQFDGAQSDGSQLGQPKKLLSFQVRQSLSF